MAYLFVGHRTDNSSFFLRDLFSVQSQTEIYFANNSPKSLKAEMVKDDAEIIDVGINCVPDDSSPKDYYITGDVDFENVSKKASFITLVPDGVGPMTIACFYKAHFWLGNFTLETLIFHI